MPIPKEILGVKRPVNTIVGSRGKDGSYAVRERSGCKYVNGKPHPINGKVIGHIIDGEYVPKTKKPTLEELTERISALEKENEELRNRLAQYEGSVQ